MNCVYTDFSKAFDKVNVKRFAYKLGKLSLLLCFYLDRDWRPLKRRYGGHIAVGDRTVRNKQEIVMQHGLCTQWSKYLCFNNKYNVMKLDLG